MCGICGIIDFSGKQVDRGVLESMTNILVHRGPDDSGIYCQGNVGLGHRRLSIIDLSPAGHQPMFSDDGAICIVFNGEIYNFQELKLELIRAGHSFRSNSDTEVIIHGYEEWGQGCWERLDGMFAFAFWDARTQQLFLVRDPFAVKPLYYWHCDNKVIFASEIKSLLASGLVERQLNRTALSDYLTYFYTPGPQTILQNVFHVKPGRAVTFAKDSSNEHRYWELKTDDSLSTAKIGDVTDLLRQECRLAVKKSLVSDVPVGLLLSSGLDSNIILTELLNVNYPGIETITVGFRENSFDEAVKVKKRLKDARVSEHIIYLEDYDIPSIFNKMVYHLDSLNANFANLAQYLIVKSAAQHVKVVLAGAGNDELFAGYSTYVADKIRPYYRLFPRFIRALIQQAAQKLPQTGRKYSFDYLLRKFTQGVEYSPDKSHYWWRTIFTDEEKERLFIDYNSDRKHDSFLVYKAYYDEMAKGLDFENQSLYADFFLFCNENSNMMVDNLSMAFSLEVRPPFLTKRFVEFAFKVPYRFKLKGRVTKYCLRKAYEKDLPDYITWQKKTGLVSPISQLIRGPLKEMACDAFADSSRFPYFNKPYLQKILADHLSGRQDYGYQIYLLLSFMRWHEIFIP